MAKKRKNKNSQRDRRVNKKSFTESQKSAVADWLNHMCRHLENAIALSEQLEEAQLNEDNHQFWALVKYAENVQECIIQLDNMNKTILPALDEVPLDPIPDANFSWSGMKGMRQRLAHDFRRIDPKILWQTVTKDFPIIFSLVSRVYFGEKSGNQEGAFGWGFKAGVFLNLPPFEHRKGPVPGNTVVGLFFDELGKAQCLRIGRIDDSSTLRKIQEKLMDDITFVRSHWWLVSEGFSLSTANSDVQKLPATLYHRIADSLAYAA